jgi:5-methylcytosine-specific restriction endonuclease McrA
MNYTKICTGCNKEMPATLEYFYAHSINRSGLRASCKECMREDNKNYLNSMTPEARYQMKKAEQQRNMHNYRKLVRKHRAKKAGVYNEEWTEEELTEKYGTNCYLCHGPIDYDAPRKGPGSDFSSWPDHVIPTSRGGENTLRNVRPCHKKCNISKQNKTYAEYQEYLLDKAAGL